MSDKNTTYTSEGLDRLLSTLKGDAKTDGLIASFLDRCQELEDAAYPLLAERDLDNATGDRIDRIGAIVGIPRGGREDEPYRLRIRIEMAILNSDGTAKDMIEVLQLILETPDPVDIELDEAFPKALVMRARNFATAPLGDLDMPDKLTLLERAASAGTEVDLVFCVNQDDDDNIFHFSTVADTNQTSQTYGTENGDPCGGTRH